jgi:uncharacterized protein (DUF4213/DUF364 family)
MPGEIVRELLMLLEKRVPHVTDIRVSDVRIGLGYTGIRLSTGHVGVCHTLSDDLICCQRIGRAGTISGSPVLEIAELANSWKLGEAVVGIAAINALSQIILERNIGSYMFIEDADCIDQIQIKEDDTVALVGYIRPFVPVIRSKTRKLYVMEKNPRVEGEDVLPETACMEIVPKADIVIITGTAIVNGTIDHLLELSRNAREVAVAGPTASMIPDPLFKRRVTLMGGIKIINPERLLQVISEGGGVPQFKETYKQYVIRPTRIDVTNIIDA